MLEVGTRDSSLPFFMMYHQIPPSNSFFPLSLEVLAFAAQAEMYLKESHFAPSILRMNTLLKNLNQPGDQSVSSYLPYSSFLILYLLKAMISLHSFA